MFACELESVDVAVHMAVLCVGVQVYVCACLLFLSRGPSIPPAAPCWPVHLAYRSHVILTFAFCLQNHD